MFKVKKLRKIIAKIIEMENRQWKKITIQKLVLCKKSAKLTVAVPWDAISILQWIIYKQEEFIVSSSGGWKV